jgi:mannitol/fructose-specific phosphotransferase system IIA component (Ntr-type)
LGAENIDHIEPVRLSPAALDLALKASGRVDVFRRLGELAAVVSPQLDAQQVAAALLARERLGSTVVHPGLALPHARLPTLEQPMLCAVRLLQEVDFEGDMVSMAIGVLVPEGEPSMHLELLRRLALTLAQPRSVAALLSAPNSELFLKLMEGA